MSIRILSRQDILSVASMKDMIEACRLAMKLYAEKQVDIPLRTNLDIAEHNGQSLYMTGYAADADALGVKIVSVYPDNVQEGITAVPATMVLLDPKTGVVNCLMDGTTLTQLRTGAISGLATDLLARQDASVMTLIGTGGQAASQLEAILAVRPIRQVYVSGRDYAKARVFAQAMTRQFSKTYQVTIEATDQVDDAVALSDVITVVTTATQPVFSSDRLKPGAHVNGVGSFMPDMVEVDAGLFDRAGLVYVDTMDAFTEAGDFQQPLAQGKISSQIVTGELGQLVLGHTARRTSDQEITFFKTTGNAVLDIVAARRIYEIAVEQQMGQIIDL